MQDLIGQCFKLLEGNYRIVDVRRIGGEAMVYAEEVSPQAAADVRASNLGPRRAAFHYGDIVEFLPRTSA